MHTLQPADSITRGTYKRWLHQASVTLAPKRVSAFEPSTFLLPVPIMVGAPSTNRRWSMAEMSSTRRGMCGSILGQSEQTMLSLAYCATTRDYHRGLSLAR